MLVLKGDACTAQDLRYSTDLAADKKPGAPFDVLVVSVDTLLHVHLAGTFTTSGQHTMIPMISVHGLGQVCQVAMQQAQKKRLCCWWQDVGHNCPIPYQRSDA